MPYSPASEWLPLVASFSLLLGVTTSLASVTLSEGQEFIGSFVGTDGWAWQYAAAGNDGMSGDIYVFPDPAESIPSGKSMLFELFENSTADAPFHSTVVDGGTSASALQYNSGELAVWQDFQGMWRVKALAGGLTLDYAVINVWVPGPDPNTVSRYRLEKNVVPEPMALWTGGAFLLLCRRRR
jgi:hypothetical protein